MRHAEAAILRVDFTGRGDSDGVLVTRFRSGDERALEQLYRRHAPPLMGLASRLLGRTDDGDDAVHDAFIVALRQLEGLRSPDRFGAWMRQIVVNECRTRLRRRARFYFLRRGRVPEQHFETMAASSQGPEEAAELRRIAALIAELAPEDRLAWCLRFVEGCSIDEGADLSSCSVSTYKRRLGRAIRRLGELTMEGK